MRGVAETADRIVDGFVAGQTLSTDYLNRYGEALMLMEMALVDEGIAAELKAWRPVSYRAHFSSSPLRCAPGAITAWNGLDPLSQGAFDALCMAMNRLVETVVLTMKETPDPAASGPVLEIAAAAFRNLLSRATAFINSNGDMAEAAYDTQELQEVIDRLVEA